LTTLRILLIDDHAVVREGLKALINAQEDMEVVGQAGDGQAALTLAVTLRPDVAIVDRRFPRPGKQSMSSGLDPPDSSGIWLIRPSDH
jgi:DNA-binding NarL/FixJ family response regulator